MKRAAPRKDSSMVYLLGIDPRRPMPYEILMGIFVFRIHLGFLLSVLKLLLRTALPRKGQRLLPMSNYHLQALSEARFGRES
jgi:hypothetical protein